MRRDADQHRDADRLGKGLGLARTIVLVDQDAGDANVAAHLAEIFHRLADIVGDIQRLQIVRTDHDHLLAHVAGDRQAKAAAHHVAQEIEQDVIKAPIVEAQFFQGFKAVDDATTAATTANLGPAQFHGEHAVALEADVFNRELFARKLLLGRGFDDRRRRLAAKQQAGGVALGIAADQQHALALLRHHVGEVGEREALAGTALAVNGDDLGFLGDFTGVNGIRFQFSLLAKRGNLIEKIIDAHAISLQSKTILRQLGSEKA